MALRLSAKAIGLDRVKKQLRGLPKVIRNRALRTGFRKIGQLLAKDLKRTLPGKGGQRTGLMKKSVGLKVKLYRTSGNIFVAVGPRGGFSQVVGTTRKGVPRIHNPARVFHLVDRGSQRITARNYLQTVLSRNRARLPPILFEEVKKVVAKYASLNS